MDSLSDVGVETTNTDPRGNFLGSQNRCCNYKTSELVYIKNRAKKKIFVFTVRRPTLIFSPDPKLFYGTFSRKLFGNLFSSSNIVFYVSILKKYGEFNV